MNKNLVALAGLTLTGIVSLGINQMIPHNTMSDEAVVASVVKSIEYTGITQYGTAGMSGLLSQYSNISAESYSGSTNMASAGLAVALNNYSHADEATVTATKEAIEVVLKLEPEKVESIVSGYTNLGVINVGDNSYLNIREKAGTTNKVVGTLPPYSACEILSESDGWYQIKSGTVTGYVKAEYVVTGAEANEKAKAKMQTVALVTCTNLNVRQEANTDCDITTKVSKGEQLEIVEQLDGWYKVNINNLVGYVSSEYVTIEKVLPVAVEIKEVETKAESTSSSSKKTKTSNKTDGGDVNKTYSTGKGFATGDQTVSSQVKDMIAYAKQFLGNPYVSGGNSLTNGTDCSGFTKLIFAHYGYSLSRIPGGQTSAGTRVSLADVKPGDLLFYKYGSSIGHVAIYIGNGQIIHASTPKGGIRIGNALYTTPCYAVRVMN